MPSLVTPNEYMILIAGAALSLLGGFAYWIYTLITKR